MLKRTKIGCTIGPACSDSATLEKMVHAGMNFARLNFSHGTYETHQEFIDKVRAVEKITGRYIGIMQDLTGPRIRIGNLPPEGLQITGGAKVTFAVGRDTAAPGIIPIEFAGLETQLKSGERMLIDDGRIEVLVESIQASEIIATVTQGGTILPHKGLNFPDTVLSIPVIREKDRADLKFGVTAGVDMVALSFVKDASDIKALRALIQEFSPAGKKDNTQIFAKIERHEAVRNIDSIIAAVDGIMVARGDLGLELLEAEVPLIQKKIIDAANAAGKPVIVATQLLDSMQHSRRPTRAEVSDVANAVIDHADALLLTNETAAGEFPVEAVKAMAEICVITEDSHYDDTAPPKLLKKGAAPNIAITELARILAEEVKASCILAGSLTGETGRLLSQVRPPLPIMVATEDERTARQLNISWGVVPFVLLPCKSVEEFVKLATTFLKKEKLVRAGDKVIIVAGEPVGQAGKVNLVEVRDIL